MPVLRVLQTRIRDLPIGVTVAVVAVATALLRLPFFSRQEYPDEGGLLLVASQWSNSGPGLYGHLFVDRPPGLLLVFRLAALTGDFISLRALGLLLVVATVVLAGHAGRLLAGRRGALAASLTAAALLSNPMLGGHEVNAEVVGLPLVMAAVLIGLIAVRRSRHDRVLLVGAGLAAGAAPWVKQNLLDGLVFLAALLIADGWARRRGRWPTSSRLALVAIGAAVPALMALIAAASGPGLGPLWEAVVTFRVSASEVLAASPSAANDHRVLLLLVITFASGLGTLLLAAAWRLRGYREPAVLAAAAMLVAELGGVIAGGSYWAHYLLALIPGTGLLVARATRLDGRRLLPAALILTVVSALVAGGVTLVTEVERPLGREGVLAAWLAQARHPGDTGVVVYGQPQVLHMSGLQPGYPYLWSLPIRVLDPELHQLTATLGGTSGPDWVVVLGPLDTWSLDASGAAQATLTSHYRLVATACGFPIYLRDGNVRSLPALPVDC